MRKRKKKKREKEREARREGNKGERIKVGREQIILKPVARISLQPLNRQKDAAS